MVYKSDVYGVLTGSWQSTGQIAAQVEKTTKTRRMHQFQVWQALDALADRGMAERFRDGKGAYWRKVRWRWHPRASRPRKASRGTWPNCRPSRWTRR